MTALVAAGAVVLAGGAAVAVGAGFLSPQNEEETEEVIYWDEAEASGEDVQAVYQVNLLRGEKIGQPLLDTLWNELAAEYQTVNTAAETEEEEEEEEETEEETEVMTVLPVVEIPPVVVAPVNDAEDPEPQTDGNKGTAEVVDMTEVKENDVYENISHSYGIDVSKWQGSINWSQVASSGIEFAIIRVGYSGSSTGEIKMDPYFEQNIKGALANGIKVGVYFYSQAVDEEEALVEAAWVCEVISKYQITYPVVYDCEGLTSNRIAGLTKTQRSKNAAAFLSYVRLAGYSPMMYASKSDFNNMWDLGIINNCRYWLAHYTSGGLSTPSDYGGSYQMWQYTSKGSVPGISGYVDMDIAYFSYSNTADPVVTSLTYTVTDEEGTAVPGATVQLTGSVSRKTMTAETDANGAAAFSNVVVDDYTVSIISVPSGYTTTDGSSTSVSFGMAEASYSGTLKLKRVSGSVTVTVTDQKGAPVEGVTLSISGTPDVGSSSYSSTASTGSDGNATFGSVPLGSYTVGVADVPSGYDSSSAGASISLQDSSTSASLTITKVDESTEPETQTEPDTSGESESSSETETQPESVTNSESVPETTSMPQDTSESES